MMTRFDRHLRLGYGVSIVILLAVTALSYLALQSLLRSNRAVQHSNEVVQTLEKVLSVMKDAETGQRGYLLTGKDTYLEPYNGAYREAHLLTSQLLELTADNHGQQAHITDIRQVLDHRLNLLQQVIDKKQQTGQVSVTDLDAGKAAMDALRRAVQRAESQEQSLLKERTAVLDRYTGLVPNVIWVAALFALGITAWSYRSVRQDFREKERLRAEVEQQQEETAALNEELTAANEEITASIEEVTAVNEELTEAREALTAANESLEQRVAERTQALQESEAEAQALNEELTAINEEMAATNEELLATNEELAESERRLQELVDELRLADERSAKLVAIVESSDDAIIGKNLEGIITSWNRGAEQIFGYTENEIVGKSVLTLIPEDLQHEEPVILGRLRNGEKIDHYETIRRAHDGRLIDVSLTISPIKDKEGRVIGVSKIARDITEQKRDEQRKNDFIGMASHELKTPLTSLTALIQVLQMKLSGTADEFVPTALGKAIQQARRMTALINGFLSVSRLESGKLVMDKRTFELTALIREMIDEISLTTSTHSITFEPAEAIEVLADHDKIGSVISNLLSNAVKYSPKGKSIQVDCVLQEKEVLVSVKDEGMGVRPQDIGRLFERYYRVESEHTKQISGFGVGLYLSAEIIQRHDGRIWVESEKGIGSTFYFTLPRPN